MSLTKKLGMGLAPAALGLSLLVGGTYAYFSDTAEATGTFAAGHLDLSVDPETIIEVDNMKPGDWMDRVFYLDNNGTLDISSVILNASYTVTDAEGNNTEDLGKYIQVNFLENVDKGSEDEYNDIIYQTTLYDLQNMSPDLVELKIINGFEESGIPAGESDLMFVQFEFIDNGQDQNRFQGDSLEILWSMEAHQTSGEKLD